MTVVVDASVVVSGLVDASDEGAWSLGVLRSASLAAPAVLPFEVMNVLRRLEAAGKVDKAMASVARTELFELSLLLVPLEPLADRVWALRGGIASHDASYVALSELLDAPLATLDAKLANAPGAKCAFLRHP